MGKLNKTSLAKWIAERFETLIANSDENLTWNKCWTVRHQVGATGKPYRGINAVMTNFLAYIHGYKSNVWLTSKRIRSLGGEIQEDQKDQSTMVILCKHYVTKEGKKTDRSEWEYGKHFGWSYRYFNVWNADQLVDPSIAPVFDTPERENNDTETTIYEVLTEWVGAPTVGHGGSSAFYRPSQHHVQMPYAEDFDSTDDYYSVLGHEVLHSTGHKNLLNRGFDGSFGTEPYAREELIAQMGTAMLASELQWTDNEQNSAAYIKSWMGRIKEDPTLLYDSAMLAQRGVDLILGRTFDSQN